ncbi:DedA family protein [Rhodopirellula europaea]|jgi:membrane protein DedA with SNARE-associated domain|uniref:DedA family protein n=1 Tax=Rhodopirellula europaea SH398 TaxID=1263868 RepID=M5SBL3_9BACT|nr:DedA family protein [Rhodopirellula europaea]EMI28870.1 DedA family protein [Rhodopirellula europaea SH398]
MDQWIESILEQFGAFGVGMLMLLENVFPPIPSELVMPWAGYSVSQGQSSFLAVVIAGSTGSFIGAYAWYWVARRIGKERLSTWVDKHGAWLTISRNDIDQVDRWFERWGAAAVLLCRLIPGLRTLISVPAGFADMPPAKFSAYTAIGTIAWTALLAVIGLWLGKNYGDLAGPLSWVSSGVIAVMLAIWIYRLVQQHRTRSDRSVVHSR